MKITIKSMLFLIFIIIQSCILFTFYLYSTLIINNPETPALKQKQALASSLVLTDPALWTEARYTRHPSQTDYSSAFQDFPGSPDHFPAGSILAPIHPPLRGTP